MNYYFRRRTNLKILGKGEANDSNISGGSSPLVCACINSHPRFTRALLNIRRGSLWREKCCAKTNSRDAFARIDKEDLYDGILIRHHLPFR